MKTKLLKRLRKDATKYRRLQFSKEYDCYVIQIPQLVCRNILYTEYENLTYFDCNLESAKHRLNDVRRDYILNIVRQMRADNLNNKLKKL